MLNSLRFVLGFVLAFALSTVCFAGGSEGVDLSLAKQWESRGNFAKAGLHYDLAARQEHILDKRAKLHQKSLKMYLKTDDFNSVEEAGRRMASVARDGGTNLYKELSPDFLAAARRQADRGNNTKAYEYLSSYLIYHPKERNKLADEFNRAGKKELAFMLNPELRKLDCKNRLGQAQKASNAEEAFGRYSQYVASCAGLPVSASDCQTVFKAAEISLDPLVKLRYYSAGKMIGCQVPESDYDSIVGIIRKFAKTPDERGSKKNENAANLGRTLLPADVVEREVPEIVSFDRGVEKIFDIQPGEQTEFYLTLSGNASSYKLDSNSDSEYYRIYKSGRVLDKNANDYVSDNTFRLMATKKSRIKIIFQ